MRDDGRTEWVAPDLKIKSEPLLVSLLKYDMKRDRWPVRLNEEANLVSSRTRMGRHRPVIDLDVPVRLEPSSTPGHTHLYIDVTMSWPRYVALLAGLYFSGVIEMGFFVWSLRRKGTWVRKPGVRKTAVENTKSEYGWIFRQR